MGGRRLWVLTSVAARCPPALEPMTPTRPGSRPHDLALARMAQKGAGNGETTARRQGQHERVPTACWSRAGRVLTWRWHARCGGRGPRRGASPGGGTYGRQKLHTVIAQCAHVYAAAVAGVGADVSAGEALVGTARGRTCPEDPRRYLRTKHATPCDRSHVA